MEELQYLNAGGLTYAYRRYGDPEAPAVVLLMGVGLSMEAWPEGIISGLLAEGLQVITPDNRDAGSSFRFTGWQPGRGDVARAIIRTVLGLSVSGEYALEDMALDIERLLDHLGIRRAHVAGVSMGGMIAQVFATQCPNRVATLTSISSAVGNPKTGLGSLRAILAVAGTGDASSPEASTGALQNCFDGTFRIEVQADSGRAGRCDKKRAAHRIRSRCNASSADCAACERKPGKGSQAAAHADARYPWHRGSASSICSRRRNGKADSRGKAHSR